MTNPPNAFRPSIVIRCFDEEEHIGKLLTGIFHQTIDDPEVIVVDSGSTDRTLDIAREFPVTLMEISSSEFTFGRSLNRGCAAATGDILVFISAHCYPTHDDWLEQLLAPFRDPSVQLVYGKQRGNERTKFSEHRVFEQWFPDTPDYDQKHSFANNANCAIRRQRWLKCPYDEDLPGLEDLAWSKQVLEEGGGIVYRAAASIVHVHEEAPLRLLNRYRREGIAFKQIFESETFSLFDFARLLTSGILGDVKTALRDGVFLREGIGIVVFRLMQYWGTYRGFTFHGPMETALKRQLFYPHPPRPEGGALDPSGGKPIAYSDVKGGA